MNTVVRFSFRSFYFCLVVASCSVFGLAQTVLPPLQEPKPQPLDISAAPQCAALDEFDCGESVPVGEALRPKALVNMPLPGFLDMRAALTHDNDKRAGNDKTKASTYTPPADPNGAQPGDDASFKWTNAMRQSLAFLGIQHAFRLATEAGTRAELKGPVFKDYFKAVSNLAAWDDGDPFLVNYIGHPMMGSVTGYIQVHNDPKGITQELGWSNKDYWKSRLKAFGWSFAYSTQFELGLFGEAGIGNIGIRPYEGHKHPMAYVDLVVTPVVGTAWLVGEDALDKYLIRYFDRKINNRTIRVLIRGFLNPTRSMANVLRGKYPWYRDDRSF